HNLCDYDASAPKRRLAVADIRISDDVPPENLLLFSWHRIHSSASLAALYRLCPPPAPPGVKQHEDGRHSSSSSAFMAALLRGGGHGSRIVGSAGPRSKRRSSAFVSSR